MHTIPSTLCTLALTVVAAGASLAQTETPGADTAGTLRIATGKHGKGYSKLFADIRSVCGAQVPLSEVETEGGLQNLTTLAANQADLGFVQLDTLQSLKDSDESIAALQAVLSVNMNLLHIVARADGFTTVGPKRLGGLMAGEATTTVLGKFTDMKGLPIAVVGSARSLGRELDRRYAMGLQFVDVETDEQGLAKLKANQVAAMLSTSGWPSGPILKLKRDAGLTLLPFDAAVQPPYQLVRKNYENLNTFNHGFLAAPNLLVTRPFNATGSYGKAVAALQACIQKNLPKLQDGAFEPAWREAKSTNETYGWSRYVASAKR